MDSFKLDIEDIEFEEDEEQQFAYKHDYKEPLCERGGYSTKEPQASNILMQPEMKLLMLEKQREQEKVVAPKLEASHMSEKELLMRRFPWMAESLKKAWDDLENDSSKKIGSGKFRSSLNKQVSVAPFQNSLLKSRKKDPKHKIFKDDQEEKDQPKVVFSRNIPLLMYNKDVKKCIRLGGNKPTEKDSLEELYRAINFNPELKRITLDLEDLRFPEKNRPLRLALSYISSNTLHNPSVISDDMCKFSYKKELMIRVIVAEIERRLKIQRGQREDREERLKVQDKAIEKQKEEEELRGRDIITATRLLAESKKVDKTILSKFEQKQERERRIRLRTKAMPTAERADHKVKQKRVSLINPLLKPS